MDDSARAGGRGEGTPSPTHVPFRAREIRPPRTATHDDVRRGVPGPVRAREPARRTAVEVQVASQIEQLVPRRLVGLEGSSGGEHATGPQDDHALRRHVRGETAGEQLGDLALEAERSGGRDPRPEVVRRAVPAGDAGQRRVLQVDLHLERGPLGRREDIPRRALFERRGARDAERRRLRRGVEPEQRGEERERPAVGERHLRPLDFDDDAAPDRRARERGEEVLDRRDPQGAVCPSEGRRADGRHDAHLPDRSLLGAAAEAHGARGAHEAHGARGRGVQPLTANLDGHASSLAAFPSVGSDAASRAGACLARAPSSEAPSQPSTAPPSPHAP